tara:strand:+ start:117 stop:620 length:504 start_codon:yes stop_codon:yes gene_type:complete
MPITLVVEDGTGLSTANTYISLADAETYFLGRLNVTDWSGATDANKDIALAMATTLLDDYFKFEGDKVTDTQALEWPRFDIHIGGFHIPSTTIPQRLKDATAEYAMWLLRSDRTAEEDSVGFKSLKAGSLAMEIDPNDRAATVPDVVVKMLAEIGTAIGGGNVKVTR